MNNKKKYLIYNFLQMNMFEVEQRKCHFSLQKIEQSDRNRMLVEMFCKVEDKERKPLDPAGLPKKLFFAVNALHSSMWHTFMICVYDQRPGRKSLRD